VLDDSLARYPVTAALSEAEKEVKKTFKALAVKGRAKEFITGRNISAVWKVKSPEWIVLVRFISGADLKMISGVNIQVAQIIEC